MTCGGGGGRYHGPRDPKLESPPPPSLASRSGDTRNKYFQARGHGLARPRGVAAGQRLFIAASGRCPEAITTDGVGASSVRGLDLEGTPRCSESSAG